MKKTLKVMDLIYGANRYVCIEHFGATNPYVLYRKWYDMGWHTKKLVAYADMTSVLCYVMNPQIYSGT